MELWLQYVLANITADRVHKEVPYRYDHRLYTLLNRTRDVNLPKTSFLVMENTREITQQIQTESE